MRDYGLITGALEFFQWCRQNDATATVCFTPSCSELEIRIEIFGEYEFYRKRACDFESALDQIIEDYGQQRTKRDDKSRYEHQESMILTLKSCLEHYKQERELIKSALPDGKYFELLEQKKG